MSIIGVLILYNLIIEITGMIYNGMANYFIL